jgi:menaquinone-dependent protoporphyrinogen oxidase
MKNTLILYSTTDGHTLTICQTLQTDLQEKGHNVDMVPIKEGLSLDLMAFDNIVIGASIRYGKHHESVYDFVHKHYAVLNAKPSVFFSVCLVARKPNRRTSENNPYVKKFLKKIPWKPTKVAVFAGKINYPIYGPLDRMMIRLIMYLTDGPTDPKTVEVFTDWDQVRALGETIDGLTHL